jgi:hypothetical protein
MPDLPGLALKDGRIYLVPVRRLWRGFTLYPSGFSRDRFTIFCAVAPLYKPEGAGAVLSGLGDRLPVLAGRGDAWWQWRPGDGEAEAQMMADIRTLILDTGLPFLERLPTVADVASRLASEPDHSTDPHLAEALAYSLILTGEYDHARKQLALLRRITLENQERAEWWRELNAGTSSEGEEDWVIAVGKRGADIQAALERSSEEAVGLLNRWNEAQLDELRLRARHVEGRDLGELG